MLRQRSAILLVAKSAAASKQLHGKDNQWEVRAASLLGSLPGPPVPKSTDDALYILKT